ncbi:Unknown protein [Striga hermonthica]|uniref:Uncharacterized protein n=1 Tax=Striga hermonthica TaxID=68872 RepID=A0A9N7NPC9_STRHE|nr:Unknown protein [Striga hermonthica]
MTHDEIFRLVDEAIDCARQNASGREVQWASLVVVGLVVRTAQQEGESNEAVMDRVIRAQYLVPMSYLSFTYFTVEYAPKIYNIPYVFIRDIRKKVDKIDASISKKRWHVTLARTIFRFHLSRASKIETSMLSCFLQVTFIVKYSVPSFSTFTSC